MNWNELREKVKVQMDTDPQRGTLNHRAMQGVEQGLAQLAASGFQFHVVSGGLAPRAASAESHPLGIADAMERVQPGITEHVASDRFAEGQKYTKSLE